MSTYTDLPIPFRATIPTLHSPGEVLKLPLRKSVSAYGRDDWGAYDYSLNPAIWGLASGRVTDLDGTTFSGFYYETSNTSKGAFPADFTIEAWVYLTSATYQFMYGGGGNSSLMVGFSTPNVPSAGQTAQVAIGRHNVAWDAWFGSGTFPITNTWCHVAISRASGVVRTFINGVQLGSDVADTQSYTAVTSILVGTHASCPLTGRMCDFRTCQSALYTSNFTPPARGSMVLPQDLFQYNPYEVLNLPLTGHTTDLSFGTAKAAPQTAHVVTLVGSPTVDSDGLHLNGSSQYATVPTSVDFSAAGDFVWEFDFTPSNISASQRIATHSVSYTGWEIYVSPSGIKLEFGNGSSWFYSKTHLVTIQNGVRYNCMVSILSGKVSLTVNGNVIVSDDTLGGTIAYASTTLSIGAYRSGMSALFAGVIHKFRMFKGTSVAPASTYQYALQDFRVARNGAEVAVSYPLRGRDPISGIVDGWTKGDWSSTADNVLECYIGNADAEPPTEEVEWPAAYKELWYRTGFAKGLIVPDTMGLINGAYVDQSGMFLDGNNDFGDVQIPAWLALGSDQFTLLEFVNFRSVEEDCHLQQYTDNNNTWYLYQDADNSLRFQAKTGGVVRASYQSAAGVVTTGEHTIIFSRTGTGAKLYVDGVEKSLTETTAFGTIGTISADLLLGTWNASSNFMIATWLAANIIIGASFTADQSTILDRLLRQWATFNEPATVLQSRYEYESISRSVSPDLRVYAFEYEQIVIDPTKGVIKQNRSFLYNSATVELDMMTYEYQTVEYLEKLDMMAYEYQTVEYLP